MSGTLRADETAWSASADPAAMIRFLTDAPAVGGLPPQAVRASARKLLLFGCACLLRARQPLAVASSVADDYERRGVNSRADGYPRGFRAGLGVRGDGRFALAWAADDDLGGASQAEKADLVREIFGDPWVPPFWSGGSASPAPDLPHFEMSRAWLTAEVKDVAAHAYHDRDFGVFGALADALERAGCVGKDEVCWSCQGYGSHLGSGPDRGNPDCDECAGSGRWTRPHRLVSHLRQQRLLCRYCNGGFVPRTDGRLGADRCRRCEGLCSYAATHVRGCWALDLLLEKS